jgi:hypothetical protein
MASFRALSGQPSGLPYTPPPPRPHSPPHVWPTPKARAQDVPLPFQGPCQPHHSKHENTYALPFLYKRARLIMGRFLIALAKLLGCSDTHLNFLFGLSFVDSIFPGEPSEGVPDRLTTFLANLAHHTSSCGFAQFRVHDVDSMYKLVNWAKTDMHNPVEECRVYLTLTHCTHSDRSVVRFEYCGTDRAVQPFVAYVLDKVPPRTLEAGWELRDYSQPPPA